jgi:ABC-type Fe3+/spermidine/putrescine transport system ATPase subunit
MTISDRIALMHSGKIIQVGSPKEIYENPDSVLVADFIGRTNIMRGEIRRSNHRSQIRIGPEITLLSSEVWPREGDEVAAIIRPEAIKIVEDGSMENQLRGVVTVVTYLGSVIRYRIDVKGVELVVDAEPSSYGKFREKDAVTLSISMDDIKLLKSS